jgi:hypothetical protein
VVRLAAFNNFKGRIGNCDLLTTTQEKSVHNAYSLDSKAHTIIFESLALEPQEQSYGSVIITSEVLTEIKKIESNESTKKLWLTLFLSNIPSLINMVIATL